MERLGRESVAGPEETQCGDHVTESESPLHREANVFFPSAPAPTAQATN